MSEVKFMVRGIEYTRAQLDALAKVQKKPKTQPTKAKRVSDASEATESHGFRVLGYSQHDAKCLDDDYKAAILSYDQTKIDHPGSADEFRSRWMAKKKPKRISKTYSLRESAAQFLVMAEKSGYWGLQIEEILKG